MTDIDNLYTENQIKLTRKFLKLKIFEDNITFRGHEQERNHVHDLMKRTVLHGESHSALMIGPRGSGKTTLINSVLEQLRKEVDLDSDAIIVKLNGLMHHEEKLALKSITAQMQLENAVGDRVFGTFAENLSFLLSCLQSGVDRRCKSMIFILEEFDMFCHSGRTQTLLYNLFDITHAGQSPMCVIGITNRIDVMELLEKRVKSRFSHRHIFLFPSEGTLSDTMSLVDKYRRLFVELLSLPIHRTVKDTPKRKKISRKKSIVNLEDQIEAKDSIPHAVLSRCNVTTIEMTKLDPSWAEDWNSHIESLSQQELFIDYIEKMCYYTVNEQIFRNILFQIVCKLSPTKPYIDLNSVTTVIDRTVCADQRVEMLQSLSILQLSLVIATMHAIDVLDDQPINFEMVLHRYTKFANTNSSTQTVPRPVILKAFEHLQALEIIMPIKSSDSIYSASETTASRVQKEYKLFTLAVPKEDIKEAVKGFKALPTEISHWLNNSIE